MQKFKSQFGAWITTARSSRPAAVALGVSAAALAVSSAWLVVSVAGSAEPSSEASQEAAMESSPAPRYVDGSAFDWIGPAGSLEKLLETSEVVVLAEVTGIVGQKDVLPDGYDPDDGHLREGVSPGARFTDLEVTVIEYIKGSGPRTLVVTQTGDLVNTDGYREFPKPAFNEPMLFFLARERTREPEVVWASYFGAFGRMSEVGGTMLYAWRGDEEGLREVPWLAGKSLAEAVEIVRQEVVRAE